MHAIYGLFAQGVIVAMIIRFAREIFGRKGLARFGMELWIPAAIVLIVPIAGVSLAGHLRGLWGDPSIVTFLLLFLYSVRPSSLPNRPRVSTCALVSLFVMLPLYLPLFLMTPSMPVDLYAIGWHPKWILIAIAVIAFGSVMMQRMAPRWTNIIAIALIASSVDLMESDNLWDYLVDPGLLFTIAFLAIAGSITSFLGGRMLESIKNLSSGNQT